MSLDTLERTDAVFVGATAQDAMVSYWRTKEPVDTCPVASRQSSSLWWTTVDRGTSKSSHLLPRTKPLKPILTNSFIDRALLRLKEFASYESDWDGESAAAPDLDSLEAAATFLQKLEPWHPRPVAALSSAGLAVIEFYDDGNDDNYWGSITFFGDNAVEIYISTELLVDGDRFFEGDLSSQEALHLLSNGLQITVRP